VRFLLPGNLPEQEKDFYKNSGDRREFLLLPALTMPLS
jgi:hypothetical protein